MPKHAPVCPPACLLVRRPRVSEAALSPEGVPPKPLVHVWRADEDAGGAVPTHSHAEAPRVEVKRLVTQARRGQRMPHEHNFSFEALPTIDHFYEHLFLQAGGKLLPNGADLCDVGAGDTDVGGA